MYRSVTQTLEEYIEEIENYVKSKVGFSLNAMPRFDAEKCYDLGITPEEVGRRIIQATSS